MFRLSLEMVELVLRGRPPVPFSSEASFSSFPSQSSQNWSGSGKGSLTTF